MNSLTPLELLDIIEREHNFESPSLRLALTRAKKEHELLKLYRKHINNLCKQEREGVKNSLFSSEVVAYELYEQIKQKEKELEEMK